MKNPINEETVSVTDLGLAAALAINFPLIDVSKENPKRVEFVFQRTEELEYQANKYWLSQMKVSALEYFSSIKNLKAMLYR